MYEINKIKMDLLTLVQIFFVCLLGAMSPGPSMVVVIKMPFLKEGIMVF